MRAYIVHVVAPKDVPIIGDIDTVEVQAHNHPHASLQAEAMRSRKGWPRGCTYRPRLRDDSTFDPSSVDSNFALFGALPAVRC